MTSNFASGAVERALCRVQYLDMPKSKAQPKPKRRPTFIRAWRKQRGLTLDKLSERLLVEREVELSDGQLSRIERGESPYTQDLLEALALVIGCTPADLIMRDPSSGEGMWSIWDELRPTQREQLIGMAKVIKGTGTDG